MPTKQVSKRGRGRPKCKLQPDDYLILEEPGKLGDKASLIGISRRALYNILKTDEKAKACREFAKSEEQQKVEDTLLAQATDKGNPRSVAAAQLLLKLRGALTENTAPDVNVNIALPQPVSGNDFMKAMKDITPAAPQPAALEHSKAKQPDDMTFAEILGGRK